MKSSAADRVAKFVDDLLRGRRPRRFDATPEEAEAMGAAAGLVASGPGGRADGRSLWVQPAPMSTTATRTAAGTRRRVPLTSPPG